MIITSIAEAPSMYKGFPVEVSNFLPITKTYQQIKRWHRKNRPDKIRIRTKEKETHCILLDGELIVSKKLFINLQSMKVRKNDQ